MRLKSTSVSSAPRFSFGGRIPRGGKFNFLCGHGRRTAWDSGLGTRVHAGAGVARRASIRRAAASKASGHFISLWAAGASRSQSRCSGASGGSADSPRPSATLSWVPSGSSDGRDVGIFRRSRGPSSHHGGLILREWQSRPSPQGAEFVRAARQRPSRASVTGASRICGPAGSRGGIDLSRPLQTKEPETFWLRPEQHGARCPATAEGSSSVRLAKRFFGGLGP